MAIQCFDEEATIASVVSDLGEELHEFLADSTDDSPRTAVRFHEATALTGADVETLRETVRRLVLGYFRRHRLLGEHTSREMLAWEHAGGPFNTLRGRPSNPSALLSLHDTPLQAHTVPERVVEMPIPGRSIECGMLSPERP